MVSRGGGEAGTDPEFSVGGGGGKSRPCRILVGASGIRYIIYAQAYNTLCAIFSHSGVR